MNVAALSIGSGSPDRCAVEAPFFDSVADYITPSFPKSLVIKAGDALRRDMPFDPARTEEYARIFQIAWNWRNSHAYPMRAMRYELGGKIRRLRVPGITAARMKRMSSIRKKLRGTTISLAKIQDLGGCRAILDSMDDVKALTTLYQSGASDHKLRTDRSYLDDPKPDGYRSHHFVFDFQPRNDSEEAFADQRIEIQVRTRLQHAWATAVEAVGLVRREDLKGGAGSPHWRRLFALMSSEFADAEECPLVPGTPPSSERIAEIIALNNELDALNTLENMNTTFRASETLKNAKFFLLEYDNENKTVNVRGFNTSLIGSGQYDAAEQTASSTKTTVLVEVDRIENLREAYPNYYLDVRLFTQNLRCALIGQPLMTRLVESSTAPAADTKYVGPYDLTFLRNWPPKR